MKARALVTISALVLGVAVLVVACADEDEKRPPLLTGSSGGTHPCERIRGLCAPSAAACGEGRVSAGSSVGCEGSGAVCCILGSDAALPPSDSSAPASDASAD